jgi:hypothetical protein
MNEAIYLTPEWKSHKLEVIKIRGCECESDLCPNRGKMVPLTVHHISYAGGIFGPVNEKVILCHTCHAVAEASKAIRRGQKQKAYRCTRQIQDTLRKAEDFLDFGAA